MKKYTLILILTTLFFSCSSDDDNSPTPIDNPVLTTTAITNISQTTATSGGNITSDGGGNVTARGVVWSTNPNPTTANAITNDGNGTGSFTSNLTGLTPGTTYYVRAYATNSAGTTYGNEVSFISSPLEAGEVFNPITGKTWMDKNLGASQVATSSTDINSYGDLYQWGRGADGHQIRTSGTTSTLSSSDNPGHGDFILAPNSPYDWRSPQNNNLWQGVNGVNNPCPSGYRIPTEAELNVERMSWSSDNAAGAFASPLKLPMAGHRVNSNGALSLVGTNGFYWSSTVGRFLFFDSSSAILSPLARASGASVRCLKN